MNYVVGSLSTSDDGVITLTLEPNLVESEKPAVSVPTVTVGDVVPEETPNIDVASEAPAEASNTITVETHFNTLFALAGAHGIPNAEIVAMNPELNPTMPVNAGTIVRIR